MTPRPASVACLLLLLLAGCSSGSGSEPARSEAARPPQPVAAAPPGTRPAPLPARRAAPLLVAVGDIACRPGQRRTATRCHHAAVARVTEGLRPDAVALLGDIQYNNGAAHEFRGSFHPTWGRLKPRLRPAVGNHEYNTPGAEPYYEYFADTAGAPGLGYYSYELGAWHVVVLNSNCAFVSCAPGSDQERWLRADLAAHPRRCTVAYWHHPRFTSGYNDDFTEVAPLWQALHEAGADLVLAGHDHSYERFGPQDPAGRRDTARGMRSFIVGTGGQVMRIFRTTKPNSERRSNKAFGVLALTLRPDGYSWRFVPEPIYRFTDSGSARCHW